MTRKVEVRFSFHHPAATSVALAGDFNDWDDRLCPMAWDSREGVWTATLTLVPGRYEYKFLVDGRDWWNDPEAPTVPNVWGSENSVVEVR